MVKLTDVINKDTLGAISKIADKQFKTAQEAINWMKEKNLSGRSFAPNISAEEFLNSLDDRITEATAFNDQILSSIFPTDDKEMDLRLEEGIARNIDVDEEKEDDDEEEVQPPKDPLFGMTFKNTDANLDNVLKQAADLQTIEEVVTIKARPRFRIGRKPGKNILRMSKNKWRQPHMYFNDKPHKTMKTPSVRMPGEPYENVANVYKPLVDQSLRLNYLPKEVIA